MNTLDLALVNGKIITADGHFTIAEAMGLRGGRVAQVGDNATIRDMTTSDTRVMDLEGRSVIPGLVDGHAHMDREGLRSVFPSLSGLRSTDAVVTRIAALAVGTPTGEWVVTMPLGDPPFYEAFPGPIPTRWDLDPVTASNPVYIRPIWGYWRHSLPLVSVVNSRALEETRLEEVAQLTDKVELDRDPVTGEYTGIIREWTYEPLVELTVLPTTQRFTPEHRRLGLVESMRAYNAVGTTGIFEGHGVAAEVLTAYQQAHRSDGLSVRARLCFSPPWGTLGERPPGEMLRHWLAWLGNGGLGDDFLRVEALYVGSIHESATEVALRASARPYTGWAGFNYDASLPPEQLTELLITAAKCRVRVVAMSTSLLDVFEQVDQVVSIRGLRWVLGHISLLSETDVVRIARLGLVVTTHTNRYIYKEGDHLVAEARTNGKITPVPLRTLLAAGVHVSLGTDNVPISMFHPLWHVVARQAREGSRLVAPDEAISRCDALRAASLGGAYISHDERIRGSLEPGKFADFSVLSADPLTIDLDGLPEIVAEMTIVEGRVVHNECL